MYLANYSYIHTCIFRIHKFDTSDFLVSGIFSISQNIHLIIKNEGDGMQVECFYNETSETYTVHVCPDRKFKSLCQNLELIIL